MNVRDVMTGRVRAIGADATVQQAAAEMARADIGALPVARDRTLVGMLTDRDITVRVVGQGLNPETTLAGQVMTSGVLTVLADQDLGEAARLMRDRQIRRAPVLDGEQRLVGVLSLGDVAAKGGDPELSGDVLRGVSEPAAPEL